MKAVAPTKAPHKGGKATHSRKGVVNRRTFEAVEKARIEAENAAAAVRAAEAGGGVKGARTVALQKKLGKDVLEDYVGAFHQIAASYQNRIATAIGSGTAPVAADLAAFREWGGLVVKTAEALAGFQSPKFKAIAVSLAPTPDSPRVINGETNVVPIGDANAMARIYQRLVKGAQ